jgi:SAM-dependent methyltransferase
LRIESPVASEASTAVRRRQTYRSSIARGDYFVVHHLHAFLQRTLREWVKPGMRLADVGCGEQPLRTLITSLGAHYTGIDVHQNLKGVVDVVADITDMPLPDRSFDLVLCTEVLEHVSNTYAAFAELTRLCKPGGTVILTTPFCYPLHEEPYDFVRLTPHQIRKCADISNLEVIQLTTSGNELQVAATVWCNLWSRIGSGRRSTVRAVRNVLMRLPVNLAVAALTPLLDPILPRKYFLSTFCILRKRT